MSATGAPKATKQSSRKGKKAWRKNVDISTVETGLETVREEIAATGGVIAEKPDELLFAMDFGGDDKIERREAKALKPLKMDEILSSRSAVPAVDTRKRKGAVTTDGVIESKKPKRKDGVSFAQLQRLRQVAASGQGSAASILASAKKGVPDYDPWAEDAEDRFKKRAEKELEKLDFVDKVVKPQAPPTLKMRPVAQAVIGKVPAVRMPEPGISYNPEFEKWDQLLREEGEKEVELEKKRLAEEAEAARIQALIEAPEEEMESEWESSSSEEEEADEEEEEKVDEKPEVKRKTQAQRNREAKQKELARKREEEKKLKQQERELMLVKKYTRDIKYQEKLRAARLAAKGQVDDDEMNPKIMRKKRFGKIHLPRAPLELQLPDELADSLRTLKPEGNLLYDRFRSLRERGIVEARKPVTNAKKAKKTSTEKWSYKDFK